MRIAISLLVAALAAAAPALADRQVPTPASGTLTAVPAVDVGVPLPGHTVKGRPALEAVSLVGGLPGPYEFTLVKTDEGTHDLAIDVDSYTVVPDVKPADVDEKTWRAALKDAEPATEPDSSAHVLVVGGKNPRVDVIRASTRDGKIHVTYDGKEILTLEGTQPSVTMTAVEGARYGYLAYVRDGKVEVTAFQIPAVPSKPPTIELGRGTQPYVTVVWACPLKALLAVTYLDDDGTPVTDLVYWDSVTGTLTKAAEITYENAPRDARYPEAAIRWQEVYLLYVENGRIHLRVYTLNGYFQFYDPGTGILQVYDVDTGPVATYRFPEGKAPSFAGVLEAPDGSILVAGTRACGNVIYEPTRDGNLKPVEHLPHAAAVEFPLVIGNEVRGYVFPNWGWVSPGEGKVTPIPVYTSELKELGQGWVYEAHGHVYAAYRGFVSWVLDGTVDSVQGPDVVVSLPVTDPVTGKRVTVRVTTVITAKKVGDAYVTALAAPFVVNVEDGRMNVKVATPHGVVSRTEEVPKGAQLLTYMIGDDYFYTVLQGPKGGYLAYRVDETDGAVSKAPVDWFGLATRVNGGPAAVVLVTGGTLIYTPPEFAVVVGALNLKTSNVHDVSVVGPGFLVTYGKPVKAVWVSESGTTVPETSEELGIEILDMNVKGTRWLVAVDPDSGTVITGYPASTVRAEANGTVDVVLSDEPEHGTMYTVKAGPTPYAVVKTGDTLLVCPLPENARLEGGELEVTDTVGGGRYTYDAFLKASGEPGELQRAVAAVVAYLEGWHVTRVLSAEPTRYVAEPEGHLLKILTFHGTEPETFTVDVGADVKKIEDRWYVDPHTAVLLVETPEGEKAVEIDLANLRGAAYPAVTDEKGLGLAFDDQFLTTWPPMQVLFFTVKPRLTTGEVPVSRQVWLPRGSTPLWVGSGSEKGWTVIACLYVGPQGLDAIAVLENGREAKTVQPTAITVSQGRVEVTVPTPAGPVTLTYEVKAKGTGGYPNQIVYTPLIVPVVPPRRRSPDR